MFICSCDTDAWYRLHTPNSPVEGAENPKERHPIVEVHEAAHARLSVAEPVSISLSELSPV